MTRDEAAAILADIPEVKSVEVARLHPRDVIVLEVDQILSQHDVEMLQEMVKSVWPDNQVAVFQRGMRMRIVRDE